MKITDIDETPREVEAEEVGKSTLKSAVDITEPTWDAGTDLEPSRPKAVVAKPEELLAIALQKGYPPEVLKEFLEMRKELKAEWARERYYKALSAYQAEVPDILQTTKVTNKPEKGGGTRYTYAKFGAVTKVARPYLKKNGFSWSSHPTEQTEDNVTVKVILHHKDGHEESSEFTAPIDHKAYMTEPQKVLSARTFAKRNAFLDITGTATADDDDDTLSFEDGLKYADYINAFQAENDLEALRQMGKSYYDQLKAEKDHDGAVKILKVYNECKDALTVKETSDANI